MVSTSKKKNFLAVILALKSNELKYGLEVQVQVFRPCILAYLDLACFTSGPRVL